MLTVHPPPPPETSLTGKFLFSRVSWIRKKTLTQKYLDEFYVSTLFS